MCNLHYVRWQFVYHALNGFIIIVSEIECDFAEIHKASKKWYLRSESESEIEEWFKALHKAAVSFFNAGLTSSQMMYLDLPYTGLQPITIDHEACINETIVYFLKLDVYWIKSWWY